MLAERTADITVGIALGNGVTLVVFSLAAAKTKLQLHPAVLEVNLQRNERIPLTGNKTVQLADFVLVQQQLLGAHRILVENVPLIIGADVHALDPDFAIADLCPGFLQVYAPLPNTLDLSAEERQTAFVLLLHEIIVPGLAILRHGFDSLLMRHIHRLPCVPPLCHLNYYNTSVWLLQEESFHDIIQSVCYRRGLIEMRDLHEMAAHSRNAAWALAASSLEDRNRALFKMAEVLESRKNELFAANERDVDQAENEHLAAPLLGRLKFGEEKLTAVVAGLRALAELPDPIGKTTMCHEITQGLKMYRVTCPIGVIGVIFESRPDALVQIASLALKSGNAVLLKGGREAAETNAALCDALRDAAAEAGLPADFAQLLHSREDVAAMLKEDTLIDLIIPRGSKEFVRYIMDNSRIPVLGHSDGICHVYVDCDADLDIAVNIAVDSKAQNVAVCNACETLLVHRDIAADYLPKLLPAMQEKHVRLLGDDTVRAIIPVEPATEADWRTEYLDYTLSIRVVNSLEEAIEHINRYGSHHTDCIVTKDDHAAGRFMALVDSAGVYRNVSTRFADGFVYGFGAEVGIATGKLHARGPMGLDGLTTYKYKLLGDGQLMAEMKSGQRSYTHKVLDEDCPL